MTRTEKTYWKLIAAAKEAYRLRFLAINEARPEFQAAVREFGWMSDEVTAISVFPLRAEYNAAMAAANALRA